MKGCCIDRRLLLAVVRGLTLGAFLGIGIAWSAEPNKASVPEPTGAELTIAPYADASFSPAREEQFEIRVRMGEQSDVEQAWIDIYTADDDRVRTLQVDLSVAEDDGYRVFWDGRDAEGMTVPDEVYYPVVRVRDSAEQTARYDARDHSGGEEIYDFDKSVQPGTIDYSLPAASRMLVRSGIKNGPMLRTIVDWEPRTAGFHTERWSGWDKDNVIPIEQNPQVGYLIIGYRLPDHSIITFGNPEYSYRQYRDAKGWRLPEINYQDRLLERNGQLVRSEYYTPVPQQKSPRIEVALVDNESGEATTEVVGLDELVTRVQINEADELYLDQQRYEISFFVDHVFIAEEEQGFVPFSWRWSPGRYGIEPGDHVLTVNVSGYRGQVGVKNLAFRVLPEE